MKRYRQLIIVSYERPGTRKRSTQPTSLYNDFCFSVLSIPLVQNLSYYLYLYSKISKVSNSVRFYADSVPTILILYYSLRVGSRLKRIIKFLELLFGKYILIHSFETYQKKIVAAVFQDGIFFLALLVEFLCHVGGMEFSFFVGG